MNRRLPPLNALRAFEAAAATLSVKLAAERLNVTPGAVSQQLRLLEETLGLTLFERRHQGLALTEAGRRYLPPIRRAFESIAEATERLTAAPETGRLTISVLPSFAIKWLVPRLVLFQAVHPGIDVLISTSSVLVDFDRQREVDLGIRHGRGDWPGLTAVFLGREEFSPVCSPKLIERGPPLREPADLARHVLLHDSQHFDWGQWCAAAGLHEIDVARGPVFSDDGLRIQAAIDGLGVALGRSALVADDLAAGRLVQPFATSLPSGFAYYAVYPPRKANDPKVVAFRDWLTAEMAPFRGV